MWKLVYILVDFLDGLFGDIVFIEYFLFEKNLILIYTIFTISFERC